MNEKQAITELENAFGALRTLQLPTATTLPNGVQFQPYTPSAGQREQWILIARAKDNRYVFVLRPRIDTQTFLIYKINANAGTIQRLQKRDNKDDEEFARRITALIRPLLNTNSLKVEKFKLSRVPLRFD